MRFVSLAVSRKTKRRAKLLLVLCAVLFGFLLAAEGRYATFRLQNIELTAPGLVSEKALWAVIKPEESRFWPLFWARSASCESLLETYYPIRAKISLRGWGRFRFEAEPLAPAFKMVWDGRFWYVAEDGRTWLATLPDNRYIATGTCDERPLLTWGKNRTTPIDFSASRGNIHVSSLPVSRILGWYKNVDSIGWRRFVRSVQAGEREGMPVVRLVFDDGAGGAGANILFVDDPKQWYEAELAVMKLFPDMGKISPKVFIDTTYKGKILVKNNVK